jgi:hypothetical protein
MPCLTSKFKRRIQNKVLWKICSNKKFKWRVIDIIQRRNSLLTWFSYYPHCQNSEYKHVYFVRVASMVNTRHMNITVMSKCVRKAQVGRSKGKVRIMSRLWRWDVGIAKAGYVFINPRTYIQIQSYEINCAYVIHAKWQFLLLNQRG